MILVTGATGRTGPEVVKILAAMGVRVRAAVRDRAKAADMAESGAEIAVADLGKPETLAPLLDGVAKAYLLSAADPQQVILHTAISFAPPGKQASSTSFVSPCGGPTPTPR